MMDGRLETIDGRAALRFVRRLDHSVERVWRAVSEPAELERWFVAPVEWTPAVGETFVAMEQDGEVTEVDPPRALEWVWGGERFRFDLSPAGDGCELTFLHVFDDRALGAQHGSGWDHHFQKLDAHLDGRELSDAELMAALPQLHEEYAERFHLSPEPGRAALREYHGIG
jgi:uncharacterized protein YndB with AHSA1/START domain